ncbi:glycosyltransferase family protein [Chryseobacterium chendengshani]|uniref:hypothetical protein n=1 Tax=Chryseobacterium sp. LJ756 TaxID=2864113 RepID=UPI001C63D6CF|nr:hypothetical protein [Chryseobacterium sp. LJ756]MBW7674089.1 hypothetical protein [Chryseobacterium sp. LJ756]
MNRRLLLILIYLYALVFSVLKTVRFPNDWSEAHWMLDYRFGFIKRGLAGEIFGLLFAKTELSIVILSAVILFLLYTVLVLIAVRKTDILKQGITYDFMFYVLFFLSQYIVFSAHLIGYLDHLIFLMTFLVIFLIRKKMIFLSSIFVTIAVLIHEISFFLMLPICFFTLILMEFKNYDQILKNVLVTRICKRSVLFLLLPLVATVTVSIYQEMYGMSYYEKIVSYLKSITFINDAPAHTVASAYTEKFSYYLKMESPHFFQRIFVSTCSLLYGIPILFMGFLMYKKFKKNNLYLLMSLGVCVLIPLLLHAIAWDTYRIWSFPFMILFLGYWVLSSENKSDTSSSKVPLWMLFIFILCLILVSMFANPLFDGEIERFSLFLKFLILVPFITLILWYLKKPQKKFEANI